VSIDEVCSTPAGLAPLVERDALEQAGCLLALVSAYRDHWAAVLGAARGVCGPASAEDVAQDVFVQFWVHPGQFDPARGSLRSFLVTVAHRKALDAVRLEANRRAREKRSDWRAGTTTEREAEIDLRDALRRLPESERTALAVAFYADRSYRETAVMLGQPEGTTKTRIRVGLRRLAATLADPPIQGLASDEVQ
jgi:RNA polymerase sigma factor (sigma-70 family)